MGGPARPRSVKTQCIETYFLHIFISSLFISASISNTYSQDRQQESDSDSEGSQAANIQSKPKPGGLSVVRPEILFGDSKVPSSSASNNSSASQINPLSLLSNLTGFPPGLNLLNNLKSLEEGSGNSMKDEFKEMLKLFGVSPEVAENLLPSGEQRQGEQQTQSDKIQKIRACVPEGSGVQSVARTVVRRSRRAALYFSRMAIVRII